MTNRNDQPPNDAASADGVGEPDAITNLWNMLYARRGWDKNSLALTGDELTLLCDTLGQMIYDCVSLRDVMANGYSEDLYNAIVHQWDLRPHSK